MIKKLTIFLILFCALSGYAQSIIITDVEGKRRWQIPATEVLSLATLDPGVYLIHLSTNLGEVVKKVLRR